MGVYKGAACSTSSILLVYVVLQRANVQKLQNACNWPMLRASETGLGHFNFREFRVPFGFTFQSFTCFFLHLAVSSALVYSSISVSFGTCYSRPGALPFQLLPSLFAAQITYFVLRRGTYR